MHFSHFYILTKTKLQVPLNFKKSDHENLEKPTYKTYFDACVLNIRNRGNRLPHFRSETILPAQQNAQ